MLIPTIYHSGKKITRFFVVNPIPLRHRLKVFWPVSLGFWTSPSDRRRQTSQHLLVSERVWFGSHSKSQNWMIKLSHTDGRCEWKHTVPIHSRTTKSTHTHAHPCTLTDTYTRARIHIHTDTHEHTNTSTRKRLSRYVYEAKRSVLLLLLPASAAACCSVQCVLLFYIPVHEKRHFSRLLFLSCSLHTTQTLYKNKMANIVCCTFCIVRLTFFNSPIDQQ